MFDIDCINTKLFANTYLVSCEDEVIIIDPAYEFKMFPKTINNYKVVGILLTHGHYDHFRSLNELMMKFDVPCYLHKNALPKLTNIETSGARMFGITKLPPLLTNNFVKVTEGSVINFKNLKIKTLYTPGHTDCSVCFKIDDIMFTGDTIFKGTIGRMDLATGSKEMMQKTLERFCHFQNDYTLYPGHEDITTLEYEKEHNRYLKSKA